MRSKNRSLKASAGQIYCTFTVFKATSIRSVHKNTDSGVYATRMADVQLIWNCELLLADTVVLKDKLRALIIYYEQNDDEQAHIMVMNQQIYLKNSHSMEKDV